MKKLFFILFIFIFASSASATVYKWVDEGGVPNFSDDYNRVPPDYRDKVAEVSMPKIGPSTPPQTPLGNTSVGAQSEKTATQPPPIAQTLIREGEFAIKLSDALKIGRAENEAEAESMLAAAGIAPHNGWISDYPLTPDIIIELQDAISEAADSGRLAMNKDPGMKAFQDITAKEGIPITPGAESQPREAERGGEYPYEYPPAEVDNYYDNYGPPVVSYYPPPWDYYYLYAWVPSPFFYFGFRYPGFFVLRDFHRVFFVNRRAVAISNHFVNPGTRRVATVDPVRRYADSIHRPVAALPSHPRGVTAPAGARNGASSILSHSFAHPRYTNPGVTRGGSVGNPRAGVGSTYRGSGPSTVRSPGAAVRPPAVGNWAGRIPAHPGVRSFTPVDHNVILTKS